MDKEILKKQLLYRSNYRGCKETDILLGKFCKAKLEEFDDNKLNLYAQLIEEDDALIYDWIMGDKPFADKYLSLIQEIRKFHDF